MSRLPTDSESGYSFSGNKPRASSMFSKRVVSAWNGIKVTFIK